MKRGRKKKDVDETVIAMYESGWSEAQLAKHFGVGRSTIHRRLIGRVELRSAVQASDLRRHRTFEWSSELSEVFDGLLLGDGSLEVPKHSESRLSVEQRQPCIDWLYELERMCLENGVDCSVKQRKRQTTSGYPGIFRTRNYKTFTDMFRRWYANGKKQVPKDVILTPRSIAHWYWGDGATGNGGYCMVFHTDGFCKEDVEFLQSRLQQEHGLKTRMNLRSGRVSDWILTVGTKEDRRKLVELIRPYCIPCFDYKLEIKQ